jgi:hypothetical protein
MIPRVLSEAENTGTKKKIILTVKMCSLVGGYQLLKERTASIFRAEVHNIQFL